MGMLNLEYTGLAGAIAANVRAETVRAGLNQMALAAGLGCTQAAVSRKWRGIRQWQLDELEPVARVIGVPLSRLLSYDPSARLEGLEPPTF